jgi:ElaB/YqjD/DUF883 family membrane-anchored ribosome-binding protein
MARNNITARFDERFDALKKSMRHLVDAGNDTAAALKDRMIDVKDSAVSTTRTGINATGRLIKEHPIAAIAIAFGVGFIAIKLIRR